MNLSPLMPSTTRLEAMALSIVARVGAARKARLSEALPLQLLRWSRPLLAAGAGLALCLWFVVPAAEQTTEPSALLSQWAMSDEVPSASRILETFEAAHTEAQQ